LKVTWKWVIYYTADALKSLYRWQYRTRTLKKATQKTKTLSSSKELTSWVKLQVQIFCKARLRLALQKISTCSLTHDVSSLEDDNIKCLSLSISNSFFLFMYMQFFILSLHWKYTICILVNMISNLIDSSIQERCWHDQQRCDLCSACEKSGTTLRVKSCCRSGF
jgi:hypothetical protein